MKKIGDKSSILTTITGFQTQNPFRKPSDSNPQGPATISNNSLMKASLRWRGSIKAGSIGLRSEWLVWVERFDNFRMDYIDFCNLIGGERYSDRLTSSTPHWANKMGLQNLNRVKVRPLWANGICNAIQTKKYG